jgi:hypothetical protein
MSVIGSAAQLVVEFIGDQRVLDPDEELTFGRSADLLIDENRYLHRVLGRFSYAKGTWWLTNVGSAIPLTVSDVAGPSFARVAPGSTIAMSFDSATIAFEAGGSNYELRIDVLGPTAGVDVDGRVADGHSDEVTTTASSLPLTDEQRLLLVALAEAQLLDPASTLDLPTNRQVAARLGWTLTKYNRKLDGLCRKFAAAGVAGLHGSTDALARDRRVRLVDHVVHAGVITPADLARLRNHRPPA